MTGDKRPFKPGALKRANTDASADPKVHAGVYLVGREGEITELFPTLLITDAIDGTNEIEVVMDRALNHQEINGSSWLSDLKVVKFDAGLRHHNFSPAYKSFQAHKTPREIPETEVSPEFIATSPLHIWNKDTREPGSRRYIAKILSDALKKRGGITAPPVTQSTKPLQKSEFLDLVVAELGPTMSNAWLTCPNSHLGGARPLDIVETGVDDDLLDALEATSTGSYA